MPSTPVLSTDQSSTALGTFLNSILFNCYVPAQTYLMQGTTPGTSASLTLTYGQQQVVIQNQAGTAAVYLNQPAGALTVLASRDTYIDLSTSGFMTQNPVSVGAPAPTQADNTIRLWKVTSGASAITAVTLLATMRPVGGGMVQTGLANGVPGLDANSNLLVPGRLLFPAQTGNTGATNVANLGLGTYTIPTNTANGVVLSVPHTQVTAISSVLLSFSGSPSTVTAISHARASDVPGTSFGLAVYTNGSNTTAPVDVTYLLL